MKSLKTPSDLAINGAPTAFEEPLHVGRPNIGDRQNFIKYVEDIFDQSKLTNNGPLVHELEQKIADVHQVKFCIAMCNGTKALEIAIRILGLEAEVIVPSFTFVATAHALHWLGLKPVFADIDPDTHSLDPKSVIQKITSRTTGIIGVHLWGKTSAVEELQSLASKNRLKLIYDASHSFGCSHNGTMIGNFGSCEILSFHATKIFNTFEGGAILTNDKQIAENARLSRNFGFSGNDIVLHSGTNSKMTEISAAMGIVNLEEVNKVIENNYNNYLLYREGFSDIKGIRLFRFDESNKNNYQYIVIEVEKEFPVTRDTIIEVLNAENVLARKYYYPGCHNMEPYKTLYPESEKSLQITNEISKKTIVLPTGNQITDEGINIIISVIKILSNSSGGTSQEYGK